MRTITHYAISLFTSLLGVAIVGSATAEQVDCIALSKNTKAIEQLAESGLYRNLAKSEGQITFDYAPTRSYADYLVFAKQKIQNENPKAQTKCPIETGTTQILNKGKGKSERTVADLIAPFELKVADSKKGILLIHGLTDSPYLFHDLASVYHAQGYNVRTLLLPGHGTAAEALIQTHYQDWQQATKFAINKTIQDFEQVYLGGYSTGGALILDQLITEPKLAKKVNSVVLWAPASQAKSTVAWAAQIADWILFLDYTHKGADMDFAKYESFPLNAAAQVHSLMNKLAEKISDAKAIPDIPLLTITTQVDSTIETKATIAMLTVWHNSKNRTTSELDTLFYFGTEASLQSLPTTVKRIYPKCSNDVYCTSINDVAHTAVTNAPSNPHYGWQGNYRNCEATFGTEHYQECKTSTKVTLGETTSVNLEKHPSLQRLTFNPNFNQMTQSISDFLLKTQK